MYDCEIAAIEIHKKGRQYVLRFIEHTGFGFSGYWTMMPISEKEANELLQFCRKRQLEEIQRGNVL